jgi:hypothetical protein
MQFLMFQVQTVSCTLNWQPTYGLKKQSSMAATTMCAMMIKTRSDGLLNIGHLFMAKHLRLYLRAFDILPNSSHGHPSIYHDFPFNKLMTENPRTGTPWVFYAPT